jgi:hypothetical protein
MNEIEMGIPIPVGAVAHMMEKYKSKDLRDLLLYAKRFNP